MNMAGKTIWKQVLIYLNLSVIGACGGGGSGESPPEGDSTPAGASIATSTCVSRGDDSTKVDPTLLNNDRETDFVRSHSVGSPTYRVVTTRQDSMGAPVTMDYMVHSPTGNPSGIVVLIAGGGLNAGIRGSTDGGSVSHSRGNFLVRSAHRFMEDGYRVITIDRPDDYDDDPATDPDLNGSYAYDAYRNSMAHAVDLATVLQRENPNNLPVVIAGTSRGAISAVANNTLAAGIALSSPVTRSSAGGAPIGSTRLPVSRIARPVHLLLHENDACSGTSPANSRALFDAIANTSNPIQGDAVSGGFRDTVRNNPCGAFDYHGFTGIENCAVAKQTGWMDALVNSLAVNGNTPPQAQNASFTAVAQVELSNLVTDAGGDPVSYALPYAESVLGGASQVDANTGSVNYNPPAGLGAGVEDSFAYVVTDASGGVGRAVIRIRTAR